MKDPVELRWSENAETVNYEVSAYGHRDYERSYVSSTQPNPMFIKAYNRRTGKPVKINGVYSFRAVPSLVWRKYVLRLGEYGKFIKHYVIAFVMSN